MRRFGMIVIMIIGMQGAAWANPLQIAEARDELRVLESSLRESKQALKVARDTYNLLDSAYDKQRRVLALLIKTDRDKQLASQKSMQNVGMNAYYSDAGHAMGSARIMEGS